MSTMMLIKRRQNDAQLRVTAHIAPSTKTCVQITYLVVRVYSSTQNNEKSIYLLYTGKPGTLSKEVERLQSFNLLSYTSD